MLIAVPPELVAQLVEEASRRGTTPELLALEGVRRILPEAPPLPKARFLLDFLAGHIGTVAGSSEPFSQNCGQVFADGLATG